MFIYKVWKQLFDSDRLRDKKEATKDTDADGSSIMSSLVYTIKRHSNNLDCDYNFRTNPSLFHSNSIRNRGNNKILHVDLQEMMNIVIDVRCQIRTELNSVDVKPVQYSEKNTKC